jgi:hypothetical protein
MRLPLQSSLDMPKVPSPVARAGQVVTGTKFSRLTVIAIGERRGHDRMILCLCECGKEKPVRMGGLLNGHVRSCGCLAREVQSSIHATHGHSRGHNLSSAYVSWRAMKRRCFNPEGKQIKSYAERGVTICERWLGPEGFKNFLADMGPRPADHTLDRINNDGNYEPSNCRWATWIQQAANRRKPKKQTGGV